MASLTYRMEALGDAALVVSFGVELTTEVEQSVEIAARTLATLRPCGMTEVVPAYVNVTVHYDPLVTPYDTICASVRDALRQTSEVALEAPRTVEIAVAYGGADGPDLGVVAHWAGLSEADVVALHTARPYRVSMIGFLPGFPYLSGVDERIAMPRRETPRIRIAAGSVGIAGQQTGIYPLESPGGWQLIGRTDVKLFDVTQASPSLLRMGDYVQFRQRAEASVQTTRGGATT